MTMQKRLTLSILCLFIIVLATMFASASDVAYIYRNSLAIDNNVVQVFEDLGYSVVSINENDITDLSEYVFIYAGDELFRQDIPVNDYPSIITTRRFGTMWGVSDDGINSLSSSHILKFSFNNQIYDAYTQATMPSGINLDYYYIANKNLPEYMISIANTPPLSSGPLHEGHVVSFVLPETVLNNGETQQGGLCYFGIVQSAYWTQHSKDLLIECVNAVVNGCYGDTCSDDGSGNDNGGDDGSGDDGNGNDDDSGEQYDNVPYLVLVEPSVDAVIESSQVNIVLDVVNATNCWYSLNGEMVVLNNCDSFNLVLGNGTYDLIVYANNSIGQISESVSFFVDIFEITNITHNVSDDNILVGTEKDVEVNFSSSSFPINLTFNLYLNNSLNDTQGPYFIANHAGLPVVYNIASNLIVGNYILNMTIVDSLDRVSTSTVLSFNVINPTTQTTSRRSSGGTSFVSSQVINDTEVVDERPPLVAYVNPPRNDSTVTGSTDHDEGLSGDQQGSGVSTNETGIISPITGLVVSGIFGNDCTLWGYYFGILGPFCWYTYVFIYLILLIVLGIMISKVFRK
ncbi:MAG: hypothetical protein ACMXYG_04015 [Candidatus Woesearchaeota archaeon]